MASVARNFMQVRNYSVNAVIKNVTVLGGGLMGAGVAQVAAQVNQNVTLVDTNEKALQNARERIETSLKRVAKKKFQKEENSDRKVEEFLSGSLGRIKWSTNAEQSVGDADLVLEAIVENLELKQKTFAALHKVAPEHTIFASNTSSLPIGEIAQDTPRKDRFAGLHFFNPVPVMKLLEVIRIPETSEETFQKVMQWGKDIGKTTVVCKDTPGFIVNRLLVAIKGEACRMVDRGDASPRDIDIAMKLGAGHPMGPIELSDYVGLDTSHFVMEGWHKRYPDNPLFQPIQITSELIKQGKLGMKTGEGFYKYDKK